MDKSNKSKYTSIRVSPEQLNLVRAVADKLGVNMTDVYRMGFMKMIDSTLTVKEIREVKRMTT